MNAILLVDDQPITNFISRKLLEVEGVQFPVYDFTNPLEALTFLKNDHKVFLFLDLNMPEMNGWEFMDKLVEIHANPVIIILTSSTSELDREKAKEYAFVVDYVVKPLTRLKLASISSILHDASIRKT